MNLLFKLGLISIFVIVGFFVYTNFNFYTGNISQPNFFLFPEQSFETISKDHYSGHDERKEYIIKDNSAWSSLWEVVHSTRSPKPKIPEIDFSKEMIVAVFQGMQATGGHAIKIEKITEKVNSIEIFIEETVPAPESFVTDALTNPYHIIKTKRVDKEVFFKAKFD